MRMMTMKLYVDDERQAPSGWVRVTTASEAIETLERYFHEVMEVSLDHDLGNPEAGTGYHVACWLESRAYADPKGHMPEIHVHSANPVGVTKIRQCIESIKRIRCVLST
jgi:hypothetical protein